MFDYCHNWHVYICNTHTRKCADFTQLPLINIFLSNTTAAADIVDTPIMAQPFSHIGIPEKEQK